MFVIHINRLVYHLNWIETAQKIFPIYIFHLRITIKSVCQKVPVNGKLGVVSRGSGVARMDVEVRYNVNVTENDLCKFSVEVFDKPVKLDLLQQQGFTPEE